MQAGTHPRVLGYLGRALSLELSAVQQYMTQASLLSLWGQEEAAERFRLDTAEEMQHAQRLVEHMLLLGVAPAASQLTPVSVASDLVGLLRRNAELEQRLIDHYGEASRFCALIGDTANGHFFHRLWTEERLHGEQLQDWLHQLLGDQRAFVNQRATF